MAAPSVPLRSIASEIVEFLQFVEDTGRPQEWRFVLRTSPPKEAEFQVVTKFSVPLKHRKAGMMVPCPVCRPNGPK
jgi:hypothetical protein